MGNNTREVLEKALEDMKTLRGNVSEYGGDASKLIKSVFEYVKAFKGWYLIRCASAPVPYAEDHRAFVFTQQMFAEAAVKGFAAKNGSDAGIFEIYEYPMYEENIFSMLMRHGIEKVCINRGANSIIISLDKLIDGVDANPFTECLDNLAFSGLNGTAEQNFMKKLNSAQLFYLADEKSGKPIRAPYNVDGEDMQAVYLFTDKVELSNQYPRTDKKIESKRAVRIFKENPSTLFVFNPAGANILIGQNTVSKCLALWDDFADVYIAVRHRVGDKETAIKYAKEIVKNKKVRDEYMQITTSDNVDYPQVNGIRTAAGYSAEMISDITDSESMEMTYAIMAIVFNAPRDNIKNDIASAKEQLS